jgi:hypothetical protein
MNSVFWGLFWQYFPLVAAGAIMLLDLVLGIIEEIRTAA